MLTFRIVLPLVVSILLSFSPPVFADLSPPVARVYGVSPVYYPLPSSNRGPTSIVAGPDGALWLTEQFGNAISRITEDGHVTTYPLPTPASGPFFITLGPDSALWFTNSLTNQIG